MKYLNQVWTNGRTNYNSDLYHFMITSNKIDTYSQPNEGINSHTQIMVLK